MPSPETILLVHNRYRESGGEDAVYEAEASLLEANGHRVLRYERHNDELANASRLGMAADAIWNRRVHSEVEKLLERERPNIVHVHNIQAVISPAVHHAAHRSGAAVVQTLHNFRLLCPGGLFLRDGAPCEACLGAAVPWRAVAHACYRNDRAASAVVAGVLVAHRALGTWHRQVDALVALSEFARDRFVAGGLPADRLHVKGGFVDPDPGVGSHAGDEWLYVGRLSPEKGIGMLLEAWRRLERPARLAIAGDGPMAPAVRAAAAADPHIEWLGALPREQVLERMKAARALVLPSVCYENFPTVLAEAYATGLPVVASDIGSLRELVEEGVTGRRFEAGDAGALAAVVQALDGGPVLAELGRRARTAWLERYTAAAAYARLLEIYRSALSRRIAAPAAGA